MKNLAWLLLIWTAVSTNVYAQSSKPNILSIPSVQLLEVTNAAYLVNGVWDSSTWTTGVAQLQNNVSLDHVRHAMVFAGHNPGIFSVILDLETGDLIYIQQGNYRSTYSITYSELIYTIDEFNKRMWTEQPEIILITCYGSARLLIHAERIKMDYAANGFG